MPVRKTLNEFVENAKKVHGNKYEYDKAVYVNMHTKLIVTCKEHGDFLIKACSHVHNQQGCAKCAGNVKMTTEKFVEKATEVHKGFYSYAKTNYLSSHERLTITCPLHGDFDQQAYVHLQNHGCPDCGKETTTRKNQEKPDIWTYRGWEEAGQSSKDFVGYTLYIIELWNDNEHFIKIGKSFNSLNRRFRGLPFYEWALVKSYTGSANFISALEQNLKTEYKAYNYTPKQKFNGAKECFTIHLKEKLHEFDRRAEEDCRTCSM